MNVAQLAMHEADARARLLTQISHSTTDHKNLLRLVEREGLDALLDWATSEKVERIAATLLASKDLLPAGHEHSVLLSARRAEVTSVFEWLSKVFAKLSAAGTTALVTESAGATLASTSELTRFCSSDIDLLIRDSQAGVVGAILNESGCRHTQALPSVHRNIYALPESLGLKTIQSLEIATVPFARKWTPVDQGPLDWFSLAQPDLRYPELNRLPPTEAFVFQSVHASLHYYRLSPGLRLVAELQWLLQHPEFSWTALRRLCDSGRFVRRVVCALQWVAEVFHLDSHRASYDLFMDSQDLGAKLAIRAVSASRNHSIALRGALEPLLDDRGAGAWLADLIRFRTSANE